MNWIKKQHKMSKKLKSFIPYFLTFIAVGLFAGYLYQNADRYQQLLNLSASLLLAMVGLSILLIATNGLLNYFLYRELAVPLTINEGIGLASVNSLANQLPFAGGFVAKGVYLKRKYVLAYTRFSGATLALYVCFVAANGLVGIIILIYLYFIYNVPLSPLLLLGFLGMTLSAAVLWLPINTNFLSGKWGQRLAQLLSGWQVFKRNWLLLGKLIALQLVMTLIFAIRLNLAFGVLSQESILVYCILFSAATILSRLISIAPGGLAVREGIVATMAVVLNFDVGITVVAVGIDRLVATSIIVVMGSIYTYVLSKKAVDLPKETHSPEANVHYVQEPHKIK
jgi:uncharacterized membrane protein YbhN (UPF0104 family)